MQILEIWNNLFTKGLQIYSSFYHICFLYFVNFKKIKIWYLFVQIWWNLNFNQQNDVDLKKNYSPIILEFYLVYIYIFWFFYF
jgi:hypothetical protein